MLLVGPASLPFRFGGRPVLNAYRDGIRNGKRQLKSGQLAYESFGALLISENEYQEILREYRIEERCVGFCTPDEGAIKHAEGFNKIMIPAIERKFGKNIFRQMRRRAVLRWRARNPGESDGVNLAEFADSR